MHHPPRQLSLTVTPRLVASLGLGAVGPVAVVSAMTHGSTRLAIAACVMVMAASVAVLREIYWVRALDRSECHQRWLLAQGFDVDDVLRLTRSADDAARTVIDARTAAHQ